ncbi:MAG: succinate--CoA ligase subunit alpha [Patescibacteria group bacterium]|nr:MAG: succinate--CoA ligase subunit alpha [Patescibacteria group bacterium]
MAILINENTRYLIQGITGKEGLRAATGMVALGALVVAGVTPGKGGQTVAGLVGKDGREEAPIPVYETVIEALKNHPEINATSIYAPPRFVLNAAKEALTAGIPLIHIIAENVPTRDTVEILEFVAVKNELGGKQYRVIGPSSVGVMSPGKSVMGSFGGGRDELLLAPFTDGVKIGKKKGGVAVLTKSGGMSLTVANMLSQAGVALSTVVGLGGDKISCTTYADLLDSLAQDDETWAVVLIGEIGGSYEEDFAQMIKDKNFKKPVVAFISGKFAENLPTGVAFGHAGAIVSKTFGTRAGKVTALKGAGALIADNPEDIVELLQQV